VEFTKLAEWNPWWEHGRVPDSLKGRERPDYGPLLDSIRLREITIITGVRRSGKSTLMYQMIDGLLGKGVKPHQILFVNFEDNKLVEDSLDDIYLCYRETLNNDKAYIFFDEVHRKDGWEAWIRKKYDLQTQNKFVISGSSAYLLKKEYSTLLTGRNVTFEVFPLSFSEFMSFQNVGIDREKIEIGISLEKTRIEIVKRFKNYVEQGGFPQVLLTEKGYTRKILEQYFDDILYKDVIDRFNLNAQKTKELALFFATTVAHQFSLRTIRNALGLSYDTTKDYLSAFKEVYLVFTLDHFSYSFKEQKTLPQKIYFIDTGLRSAVSFTFSKDEGKLVENIVFLELRRQGKEIYYWKNKGEVDFVVKQKNNSLSAINVSYTDDIDEREMKSLIEFKENFKKTKELIIITKSLEKTEKGIRFIPVWKWLLVRRL